MADINEINRLIGRGLLIGTAMKVADGTLDEEFEVACAQESREVDRWCRGRKNIPDSLTALWDLDPSKFYFAFDGDDPGDHAPADFALIEADVAEVDARLFHGVSRDKDPWHRQYKSKSCGIAYRWLHGRGVTPPLLVDHGQEIIIVGGMHRFHLAKHYGMTRMPFLVRKAKLAAVKALLSSASEIVN